MFYPSVSHLPPYLPPQPNFPGSYPYPPQLFGPRERYLAAAAEAKLAEAQYLAAEAAAQRQREPAYLDGLQQAASHRYPSFPYPAPFQPYGYEAERIQRFEEARLAELLRDKAEQERESSLRKQREDVLLAFALKEQQERAAEEQRRIVLRRDEERRRSLALLRAHKAQKLASKCRLHCSGQAHHGPPADLNQLLAALHGTYEATAPSVSTDSCRCGSRVSFHDVPHKSDNPIVDTSNFIESLLRSQKHTSTPNSPPSCQTANFSTRHDQTAVPAQNLTLGDLMNLFAPTPVVPQQPTVTPSVPNAKANPDVASHPLQGLLNQFLVPLADTYAKRADGQHSPTGQHKGLEQLLGVLLGNTQAQANVHEAPTSQTSNATASASHADTKPDTVDNSLGGLLNQFSTYAKHADARRFPVGQQHGLEQLLGAIFGGAQGQTGTSKTLSPQASTSNSGQCSASSSGQKPTEEPKAESKPTPVQAPQDASSLKEQLEARLNNEYAIEVRDTIQALLASLSDSVVIPSESSTFTATPVADNKGKGKAVDNEPVAPPVHDFTHALETVQTIETAFTALEADFVFPAQLDFTPPSSPSSPVIPLPGTENTDSATRHLAYTARNQPLRFYEHALGELLAQLDLVESFGNEELRSRRKEVVGKVERALEELEREVEGRWKVRQSKFAKEEAAKETSSVSAASNEVAKVEVAEEPSQSVAPEAPSEHISEPKPDMKIDIAAPEEEIPSEAAVRPLSPVELETPEAAPAFESVDPNISLPVAESTEADAQQVPVLPVAEDSHSAPALSTIEEAVSETDATQFDDGDSAVSIADSIDLDQPSDAVPPTTDSSVTTIKPSQGDKPDTIDTFLLPAEAVSPAPSSKPSSVEEGSDWSEIEA